MDRINLSINTIIKSTGKSERGLAVAMRACKYIVYAHLKYHKTQWDTLAELQSLYNTEHPNLLKEAREVIEDQCQDYPKLHKAANRWLSDHLVNAWKEEALEDYYSHTRPTK